MSKEETEFARMEVAKNNVAKLVEMVEFFMEKTGGKKEFVDMRSNIEMANRITGPLTIIQYTSKYFLMFKAQILKQNVEFLFNYDYTQLIEKGTINDTEVLIRSLIDGIKQLWTIGDAIIQKRIKNYIFFLLKYSIEYRDLTNRMALL
jgi:hypothetical protein